MSEWIQHKVDGIEARSTEANTALVLTRLKEEPLVKMQRCLARMADFGVYSLDEVVEKFEKINERKVELEKEKRILLSKAAKKEKELSVLVNEREAFRYTESALQTSIKAQDQALSLMDKIHSNTENLDLLNDNRIKLVAVLSNISYGLFHLVNKLNSVIREPSVNKMHIQSNMNDPARNLSTCEEILVIAIDKLNAVGNRYKLWEPTRMRVRVLTRVFGTVAMNAKDPPILAQSEVESATSPRNPKEDDDEDDFEAVIDREKMKQQSQRTTQKAIRRRRLSMMSTEND